MGKLIDFFVGKSLLVNLISLLIVVAGIFSIFSLNKETFPNVDFEIVIVSIAYPGSSAQDVEKLVAIPVERELKEVSGIEELNVISGEGYCLAILQVDPTYDLNDVKEQTRDAVSKVSSFPDEVEAPWINKIDNKDRAIIRVALFGMPEKQTRFHAMELRDRLEKLPGISKVDLDGARDQIFLVDVDLEKLNKFELTLDEISRAIADRDINLSAGPIKTATQDLIVRTFKEFAQKDDIAEIVVRSNTSGKLLQVKDVAKVELVFKDRAKMRKVLGKESIFLNVKGKVSADIIETTDLVKESTEKYLLGVPTLQKEYVGELAFFVKRRLGVLLDNGLVGIILVFLCLLLFMNFSISFVTSLGAPLAFMAAFICMDSLGLTINLISMFGLILVLGMLVDDSIIVAENFYQYLEKGMNPKEAARVAAKETLTPVSATILTTMIAFSSLFFMGGIMGKFLWPVPAVVIICLAASWIECFFILPSHLADFVKLRPHKKNKKKWYESLMRVYDKILKKSLELNLLTLGFFVVIFGISLYVAKQMRFELFPDDDVRTVYLKVKAPVGTPFEQTSVIVDKLEKKLEKVLLKNEYETITSVIGSQSGGTGNTRTGSHYAMIYLYLSPDDLRQRSVNEIIAEVSKETEGFKTNGIELSLERQNTGPPKGKPINVEISGDSLDELLKISNELKLWLSTNKGVTTTEMDYEIGKKQLLIDIKEKEARRLGVTNRALAIELRRFFEGLSVTKIRRSDEDIDVVVRVEEKYKNDRSVLDKIYIPNSLGQRILLSKVADIKEGDVAFSIRRLNRKRTISVSGDLDKNKITATEMSKKIDVFMQKILKKYSQGISYELSGENKDTKESTGRLAQAGVISLLLIFIILVAMFNSLIQPLIIMSSIPFGLIGVVAAFLTFGLPLGFMAMMGVIGLIGVVVNDSIVLVSFINKEFTRFTDDNLNDESLFAPILSACRSRFRPVILTTFTTVAGLLPIAHASGGDPFLKPMAISFAYGLVFSTTITLIFVPNSYLLYKKFFSKNKGC
jgi:multidrug efflux pump subunit AcrB